jgi:hypothetical protein
VISPRHESRQLTSASGPKLAHEPGRDDFPFPGGAGDRAGGGIVSPALPVGVAVGGVAELREHPAPRIMPSPGWDKMISATAKSRVGTQSARFDIMVSEHDQAGAD